VRSPKRIQGLAGLLLKSVCSTCPRPHCPPGIQETVIMVSFSTNQDQISMLQEEGP